MRGDDLQSRFLAIVGPSGSGKSSVVKAGLIPRLRKGAIHGSDNWYFVEQNSSRVGPKDSKTNATDS